MSFSSDLRRELARVFPQGKGERDTAAATLLAHVGRVFLSPDGTPMVDFSATNQDAQRKCFTLLRKNDKINPDFFLAWEPGAAPSCREGLAAPAALLSFLERTGFLRQAGPEEGRQAPARERQAAGQARDAALQQDATGSGQAQKPAPGSGGPGGDGQKALQGRGSGAGARWSVRPDDGTIPDALLCGARRRAYLREMFLCAGFMSDPQTRYHLEFRCVTQAQADQLLGALAAEGLHAGLVRRKSYFVAYLKDSEEIVQLLQLVGASVGLMATENARIYKGVRNAVNRRVNCEAANIGKTVASAARQLEDIRVLREGGILAGLPETLREAAALREANPDASLTELCALARPPVGRSGMNHRMRRIAALAQEARGL